MWVIIVVTNWESVHQLQLQLTLVLAIIQFGNTNPNKVTEPSLLNNNNNNNGLISVESSGLWNSNGGNNQPARSSSVTGISSNLSTINPVNSMDIELIQSTTFNCFQILQNSGQLEFGVAPLMKLFQNVKTILNKPSDQSVFKLLYYQLKCLPFSLKHDDFGNVTHVEVARTSPLLFLQETLSRINTKFPAIICCCNRVFVVISNQ